MSLEQRRRLVQHPNLLFRNTLQAHDLLEPTLTQTELIAVLWHLVAERNHIIELTAVRSDHSNDSALGVHCHANGWAVDCWFNASTELGDYLSAWDKQFSDALRDIRYAKYLHQVGLAGTAYTAQNIAIVAPFGFQDDGGDHVHIGTQEE